MWRYGLYSLFVLCLFGLINTQDVANPNPKKRPEIYKLHINSDIKYRYATTNVLSHIANKDNVAKEIFFKVTLPKAAFITYFDMTIDGVVYPGEVKEKEKAKKQYDAAVSRGDSAGYVGQQARDSNNFKVSVNVAAGNKVYFNMTYEELLERRNGKYQHVINIDPGQVVRDLKVMVNIEESREIVDLVVPDLRTSSSKAQEHTPNPLAEIREVSANHSVVTYNPSQEVQQNFSETGLTGQFVVLYDVARDLDGGEIQVVDGYFVHYFAPKGLPPVDKNVLFILDASGSMSGTKIKQVKDAMEIILNDLKPTDKFGIVLFENQVRFATKELLPVTPENIELGREIIRNQYRAQGGTNINDAVLESIDFLSGSKDSSRPSIIIFLTDGEPTSGETNIKAITKNIEARNEGRYALFSLGFGFSVDYPFLQKMSLQNNGFARKIYEDADASLQLEGFYKEVSTPVISNVNITYLDGVADPDTLTTTEFSNYFDGSEIVVAGRLVEGAPEYITCTVIGVGKRGNISLISGTEAPRSDLSRFTERMWAYLSIKKLVKEMDIATNKTEKEEIKERALELSLKYKFVTPLTSMVVTKPENEDNANNSTSEVTDLEDVDNQGGLNRRTQFSMGSRGMPGPGSHRRSYIPHYSHPGQSFYPRPPVRRPGHGVAYDPGCQPGMPCYHSRGRPGTIPPPNYIPPHTQHTTQTTPDSASTTTKDPNTIADSDPHVMIPVPGLQNPVCFDIDGKTGDIFRLLQDSEQGLVVNAQLVTIRTKSKQTKNKPSYFRKIAIISPDCDVTVTPRRVKINTTGNSQRSLKWSSKDTHTYGSATVGIDSGNNLKIDLGNGVVLSILRHTNPPHNMEYLGFYVEDGSGLSTHTDGIIGQFQHQTGTAPRHSDSQPKDGVPTTLTLTSSSRGEYTVEGRLGLRRNEGTGAMVTCWHVRNNGRRLLEKRLQNYKVPDIMGKDDV